MKRDILFPIIFWVIIGGITFAFSSQVFSLDIALLATFTSTLFYALAFYVNTSYLFPNYYKPDNSKRYFLLLISVSLVIIFACATIDHSLLSPHLQVPKRRDHHFLFAFVRCMFWVALVQLVGTVLLVQSKLQEHLELTKKITEEKLSTELKLLRAQINPHFLFNALNNIFSLSYAKSDNAPESILKLSGMLRYVIEDCANDEVSLSAELEYIQNYISFQEMKSPDGMNISLQLPSVAHSLKISPLLYIPFIENGVKYSKVEEYPDAYLDINVEIENADTIIFTQKNSIPRENKAVPGTGKGIENVKQRLSILYKDRYALDIKEEQDSYYVRLAIRCNQ